MKRLRKSKRVSWASAFNLSQVKLFLSEESPSKVGMELQNYRHANPSSALHSIDTESNDIPPGFENNRYPNMKEQLYHIPMVKWKCPPRFIMSSNWQVAAGDESEEVIVQKLREMRAMEAVYPHNSAIPPCPTVSVGGTFHEGYDDDLTPMIPIIPIEEEEEEEATESTPDTAPISSLLPALPQAPLLVSGTKDTSKTIPPTSEPLAKEKPDLRMSHGFGPDVITAAASAALTAVAMKSNEIDPKLLVQILSDPNMIGKLAKDCGAAASARTMTKVNVVSASNLNQVSQPISLVSAPTSALKSATKPVHLVNPNPDMVQPLRSVTEKQARLTNRMQPVFTPAPAQLATRSFESRPVNEVVIRPGPEHNMAPLPGLESENIHRIQNQVNLIPNMMPGNGMVPNPPLPIVTPGSVKDDNYYKNLIRQHGGDHRVGVDSGLQNDNFPNNHYHNLEMMQKLNSGELKLREQKRCVFFNSAKGCRNGSECVFKHEIASKKGGGGVMKEVPSGKRTRLCREIVGR